MMYNIICCSLLLVSNFNVKVVCEQNSQEQIKIIGEGVLEVLGISQPIRMTHRPSLRNSALEFSMEIYKDLKEDVTSASPKNDRNARFRRSSANFVTNQDIMEIEDCNNVMTFLSKTSKPNKDLEVIEIIFNVNDVPKELSLKKAELKIYKNLPVDHYQQDEVFQISVYSHSDKNFVDGFVVDQLNVTAMYSGWIEINVTNALLMALSGMVKDFGFYIKVNTFGEGTVLSSKNIGFVDNCGEDQYKPFMMGCFNGRELAIPAEKHRNKRSTTYSNFVHRFQIPKICQRLNFTVNFKQLGWNWIIAPEQFEAYFCSGECNFPLGPTLNPTNHAIVQTLMHLKYPHVPRPQCAPTRLTSVSVVYYVNDYVVNHKIFRQIVAESCGCQ